MRFEQTSWAQRERAACLEVLREILSGPLCTCPPDCVRPHEEFHAAYVAGAQTAIAEAIRLVEERGG